MSKQTLPIRVDIETKELIEGRCKEIYIKHHKDFKDIDLSNGFIIKKMVDYWIEGE